MARIPDDARDFLDEGRLAYVASVSPDGTPHCVPKGSMDLLDGEHLVFADVYNGTTKRYVEANPMVAVAIVNPAAYRGYQFKGIATIVPPGDEFDRIAAQAQRGQLHFKRASHLVIVEVTEVLDLSQ